MFRCLFSVIWNILIISIEIVDFILYVLQFLCPKRFGDHKTWQTLDMKAPLIWQISTNCKICNSPIGISHALDQSQLLSSNSGYSLINIGQSNRLPLARFSESNLCQLAIYIGHILACQVFKLISTSTISKATYIGRHWDRASFGNNFRRTSLFNIASKVGGKVTSFLFLLLLSRPRPTPAN